MLTSEVCEEMPDTKADDEVDFLSNIRESSVSEEVAAGDPVTTPEMTRQGPKTQAVSGTESACAQTVISGLLYLLDSLDFLFGEFFFFPQ